MKKTLTLILMAIYSFATNAQDDEKNFRFGLKITPSINWLKVDDNKTFEKNGSSVKFGYGLMTEFHLAGAAWLSTGFQVDYDGGKIKTTATGNILDNSSGKMIYAYNPNNGFLEVNSWNSNTDTTYESYLLRERNYRVMYLTLPLHLRLRTKEIGFMTYYGNIGVNTSIHLKTKANDVTNTGSTGFVSTANLEDLNVSGDMNLLRFGLVIGGGAEWNISGSTSMIFGIHFFQGFSNITKKESDYMADWEKSNMLTIPTTWAHQEQKLKNNHIGLTVGVLF